jgi:hypothetical protein
MSCRTETWKKAGSPTTTMEHILFCFSLSHTNTGIQAHMHHDRVLGAYDSMARSESMDDGVRAKIEW